MVPLVTRAAKISDRAPASHGARKPAPAGEVRERLRSPVRVVRYYPRALVGDGGMTKSVQRWSAAMARAGAEVVIAYEEGTAPPPADPLLQWRPVPHAGRGGVRIPLGLGRLLGEGGILVLHSGWTARNAWAAAQARGAGVPYVLEPRGAYDPHILARHPGRKRIWWLLAEGRLVRRARAIHVFFEQEKSHLEAIDFHGPFVVASNGVDTPQGATWDGGSGGYLLWLGRFDPEHKGLDVLLEAMRSLSPGERPELRLHGPDWHDRKAVVAGMVERLGLASSVRIEPAVYGDEKRRVLVRARGFVYPSRWDACPNSVLESISLGLPTLATPYPLGQYLHDRGGAFLSEVTPESLAEGLLRLTSGEAPEVGRRGAEIARTELTWDNSARAWLEQVQALG